MDMRKIACLTAAGFVGVMLTLATATPALSKSPNQSTVVVEGQRIDPKLQRKVSYRDLNLVHKQDQRVLKGRIYRTASDLCSDINPFEAGDDCTRFAVGSTREQVAEAIVRAKMRMAGIPTGPNIAISMSLSGQ